MLPIADLPNDHLRDNVELDQFACMMVPSAVQPCDDSRVRVVHLWTHPPHGRLAGISHGHAIAASEAMHRRSIHLAKVFRSVHKFLSQATTGNVQQYLLVSSS
jgi:hypothetical protein